MAEMTFTLHNPLTEEEWDLIEDVDFDHTNSIIFHTKHGKEVEFVKRKEGVESHSEKDILGGCIALLDEMVGYFSDYMEWLGYEPNEEERACGYFGMSYFKIVKRLFLWETTHSGGTSTREKCYELGIDDPSDGVQFALWDREEGEADDAVGS